MMINNRNINAAGKAETISTARKINAAIAALHERRYEARQRFLAMERELKTRSNTNVSYVTVNGISMPVPNI